MKDKITRLEAALDYAKGIIEMYENEIKEHGYDKKGLCQGVLFRVALTNIEKLKKIKLK